MEDKLSVKIKSVLDEAEAKMKEATVGSKASLYLSKIVARLDEARKSAENWEAHEIREKEKAAVSGS